MHIASCGREVMFFTLPIGRGNLYVRPLQIDFLFPVLNFGMRAGKKFHYPSAI